MWTKFFLFTDSITFSGTKYENIPISVDNLDPDGILLRLECNANSAGIDSEMSNGKPYNVYWYKDSETNRVESKHPNIWTYYGKSGTLKVDLQSISISISRYDLIIYNIKRGDAGTYYCKAESEGSSVTLGSTILSVKGSFINRLIKLLDLNSTFISGYIRYLLL